MGNALLPFASPRAQVMWGDYFARPPASNVGPATGVVNPVYAPTPPPGATMMMGPRAFASDTRSGSGVAPVSVLGTNELALQNAGAGARGSRFRGVVIGGLLGAAAVAGLVVLRPGLQPRSGVTGGSRAPAVERASAEATSEQTTMPAANARAPRSSASPSAVKFKAPAETAPAESPPPAVAPARDNPVSAARAPAVRPSETDRINDKLLDRYEERMLARREKAEAAARARATARTTAPAREPVARRPAAPPPPAIKTAPAVRPAPQKPPEDEDLLEGPRRTKRIAPILE
jgi:ribonuclease E